MKNKAKVLIVEKEGIIARDLEKVLQKLGYTVLDAAFSGQEAIRKAQHYGPDIVITEIALNGPVDGIDVANQISSRFSIPVVFLTAISDSTTIERAKIAEPAGFIIKPYEEELLHATIEMALYKHNALDNNAMHNANLSRPSQRPSSNGGDRIKTSEAGLQADWTRATFIVKKENLEKIKSLAYWDRRKVKDIIDEALVSYLQDKNVEPVRELQKKQ